MASETFYPIGLVSSLGLGTSAPGTAWCLPGAAGLLWSWAVLAIIFFECHDGRMFGKHCPGGRSRGWSPSLESEVMLGQLSMQCLITLRIHRGCLGQLRPRCLFAFVFRSCFCILCALSCTYKSRFKSKNRILDMSLLNFVFSALASGSILMEYLGSWFAHLVNSQSMLTPGSPQVGSLLALPSCGGNLICTCQLLLNL